MGFGVPIKSRYVAWQRSCLVIHVMLLWPGRWVIQFGLVRLLLLVIISKVEQTTFMAHTHKSLRESPLSQPILSRCWLQSPLSHAYELQWRKYTKNGSKWALSPVRSYTSNRLCWVTTIYRQTVRQTHRLVASRKRKKGHPVCTIMPTLSTAIKLLQLINGAQHTPRPALLSIPPLSYSSSSCGSSWSFSWHHDQLSNRTMAINQAKSPPLWVEARTFKQQTERDRRRERGREREIQHLACDSLHVIRTFHQALDASAHWDIKR